MKVVTFGELMVRLQPFNYERFVQANSLEFTFGGGEANVAVSLANYGLDAAFVTKLPAHAIGQAAINLSLIHISEPTRRTPISYAVFCLKKKNNNYSIQSPSYHN